MQNYLLIYPTSKELDVLGEWDKALSLPSITAPAEWFLFDFSSAASAFGMSSSSLVPLLILVL